MASSQKDTSPNMGKKAGKGKVGVGAPFEKGSDKKMGFNDKLVGVEPNEGAPHLSGKGVIGKCV